ncbi:MAG: plasmid stabilization protein [Sulfuricurvum sp.]|nr:plasmid stabilization protein [Sulfuricurvum sp.]
MRILELRDDQIEYLKQHQLLKKYEKAKTLFEQNPFHPSLNMELLEPKHRLLYSFRLDRKYRAIFAYIENETIEIIAYTNHYK